MYLLDNLRRGCKNSNKFLNMYGNRLHKVQNRAKCCIKTARCLKSPTIPTIHKSSIEKNTFHPYRAMPTGDAARRSKRQHRYKRNTKMNQRELKEGIKNDPALTGEEKVRRLNKLREPYKVVTDEELLQRVRNFTEKSGRSVKLR